MKLLAYTLVKYRLLMKNGDKKLAELHALRFWCMTAIDYIIKVDEQPAPLFSGSILEKLKTHKYFMGACL